MSNPRDIARALFNHDRSMPGNASRDVEREFRILRQQENDATWSALRNMGSGSSSASGEIPGTGILALLILIFLGGIVGGVIWFKDYVYMHPAGASLFLALVLIWLLPPVGLIGLGVLIYFFGGDFGHPYLFLVLLVPVLALLFPVSFVPFHGVLCSAWRHLYLAVLIFTFFAKGHLEYLIPGHTPGIEQNAIAFAWGAGWALAGVIVSMLANKLLGLVFDGEGSGEYGLLEVCYAIVALIIYGAGIIGLGAFTYQQLFESDSIIAYWT
jgi:hypothetical protein